MLFFFAESKLSLQKWLLMLHLWARECPVSDDAEEANLSLSVAVDIYQLLQEVCTNKFLQAPIILGGLGVIVQINESLFRHKPRKTDKLGKEIVHVDSHSSCRYIIIIQTEKAITLCYNC